MIQQSVCILAWLTWNTTLDFSKGKFSYWHEWSSISLIKTNLNILPEAWLLLSFLVVLAFPMDWKNKGKKCSFRSAIHALTWTDLFRERQNRGEHNFLKVILLKKNRTNLPLQTACFVTAQWHRYILIVGISLVIFTQVIFRNSRQEAQRLGGLHHGRRHGIHSFMSAKEKNGWDQGLPRHKSSRLNN